MTRRLRKKLFGDDSRRFKNGPKKKPKPKTAPCFGSNGKGDVICLCCRETVPRKEINHHRNNCSAFKDRDSITLAEVAALC